jgi:hypothetical protein
LGAHEQTKKLTVTNPIVEYYRCEQELADFYQRAPLSDASGFFRFRDAVCYGQCSGGTPARSMEESLYDCAASIPALNGHGAMRLPFDPAQIMDNLRMERYAGNRSAAAALFHDFLHWSYYSVRPLMPVGVRRHLQKLHLRSRKQAAFPQWPVDGTADNLAEEFLRMAMKAKGRGTVPFIWFWPEGMASAAIMTHDVETQAGVDFCHALMDLNDSFGIKSSFQVIPETRYPVPQTFLNNFRARGFEVNVHDLNHDGHLFRENGEFLRRVAKINRYLRDFEAEGFRAGAMYRNQEWFGALEASYDMSVPNAAHLDAQGGGCCTVMPYFVGKVMELPVTMTQDYALFNILGDYSIDLWQREIEMVRARHGLISFVVHPDYIIEERPRATYRQLLQHLTELRAKGDVWFALPREINHWWRQRSALKLVRNGSGWSIEGDGSERARIAYARLEGDKIVYSFEPCSPQVGVGAASASDASF